MEELDTEEKSKEDFVPEYSSKSDFSKGAIVQESLKKCIVLRSDEMKPGYYNYIITENSRQEVWVSDTRDKFISSVVALRNLLAPEIDRKDAYKKTIEELDNTSRGDKGFGSTGN